MKPCIQETIDEIKREIVRLNTLVDGLNALNCNREPVACIPSGVHTDTPVKASRKPKAANPAKLNGDRKPAVPNGMNDRVLSAISSLESPFDQESVHAVLKKTGITINQVRWSLTYLAKKNRLKTIEKGRAGHPSKYALTSEAGSGRVNIPGLDGDSASLEEQLQKALKDRDHARESGNTTLERIYQDKANKLQAQIR